MKARLLDCQPATCAGPAAHSRATTAARRRRAQAPIALRTNIVSRTRSVSDRPSNVWRAPAAAFSARSSSGAGCSSARGGNGRGASKRFAHATKRDQVREGTNPHRNGRTENGTYSASVSEMPPTASESPNNVTWTRLDGRCGGGGMESTVSCASATHSSQMATSGPRTSRTPNRSLLPQKEHLSLSTATR